MKRIIPLLLVVLLFAACVPTPEQDAVRQKDSNVLIDTVKRTEEGKTGEEPPIKAQFPDRMQDTFTLQQQNVQVTVDAPIRVRTEGGSFPLIRVERRILTDAERLELCRRLFHKDTFYRFELRFSRDDLVREIQDRMREWTPEEKAEWMRDTDSTEEDWEAAQAQRKEELNRLQEQYRAMEDGETLPFTVWDGSLPPDTIGYSSQVVVADPDAPSDIQKVDHATFFGERHDEPVDFTAAKPNDHGTYIAVFFSKDNGDMEAYRIAPADYAVPVSGTKISPMQAAEIAQKPLEGFGDWAISDVYWSNNASHGGDDAFVIHDRAYLVRLTPRFSDADLLFCGYPAYADRDSETNVAPTWWYCRALAVVDGDGNLLGLDWRGALQQTQVLSETTTLLPFAEIQQIFTQQLNYAFANEIYANGTLNVDDVQLGLFRIREKNDMEHGLLVPCWMFRGRMLYDPDRVSTGYPAAQDFDLIPMMIINAIDGSIIDPMNGY